VGKSPLCFPT